MSSMRLPLSGDISQFIAPWSWFVRQAGQLGFININIGQTPAPDVESRILEDVGSYGRQIGRLSDALEVLVGCLDRDSLSPEQKAAVDAFEAQLRAVRGIKSDGGRGVQPALTRPTPRLASMSP